MLEPDSAMFRLQVEPAEGRNISIWMELIHLYDKTLGVYLTSNSIIPPKHVRPPTGAGEAICNLTTQENIESMRRE